MNSDSQIPVGLSLSEWVHLCDLVGRFVPYNDAAPLIAAIGAQVVPHVQAAWRALQTQAAEATASTPEASERVQ